MKYKRGELTTQQLVTMIILIVSFIIILFLIFRLNLGETTDREICHNSVLLKHQNKLTSGPLDCRTNYLCITEGADCEGTQTSKVEAETNEEVMKALADEMAACWWQFGEGKVDYVGFSYNVQDAWGKNSCAICSIINFDESVLSESPLTYRDFYQYLNSQKKDSSQTYFNYLYDSYDIDEFQEEISYLKVDLDKDLILEDGKYAIVTGIKTGAIFGKAKGDIYIYPYYLKSDEIVSQLGCDEFVTKA